MPKSKQPKSEFFSPEMADPKDDVIIEPMPEDAMLEAIGPPSNAPIAERIAST